MHIKHENSIKPPSATLVLIIASLIRQIYSIEVIYHGGIDPGEKV
jgi:hypothetical protein